MPYKKIAAAILIPILLACICLPMGGVWAQTDTGEETTEVHINFVEGEGITPPVDPDEPGKEGGTGESGTDQSGSLTLDWVPELGFGAGHAISTVKEVFDTTTDRPYIQITDLRGTGSGWKVSAALSHFTSSWGESLQGAYLTFQNASPNSTLLDSVAPPTPKDPLVLTADGEPETVVFADNALLAGRGTWVIRWYPTSGAADLRLTVPAGTAMVGNNTATITWTLYDAP